MDEHSVASAVTTLQAQGEKPTIRKIHALIGGSFRDISSYVRKVLPGIEEVEMVLPDGEGLLAAPVGLIAQAHATQAAAVQRHEDALKAQRQTQNELRGLDQEPDELTGSEYADRQARRHTASRALVRQQAATQQAQRAVQDATKEVQRLQARARELPELIVWLEGQAGPQGQLAQNIIKWESQLQGFKDQLAQKQREIRVLQNELRAL